MTISISGASGDIGGYLAKNLLKRMSVKALVRDTIAEGKESKLYGAQYFTFTDGYSYDAAFLDAFLGSDAVIHCAALLREADPAIIDYMAINALLTGAVALRSAAQSKPPKLVYLSSAEVYALENSAELAELAEAFVAFSKRQFMGSLQATYDLRRLAAKFIKENHRFPFDQYDGYALTKYLGEAIVNQVPQSSTLRVTNAYGPGYTNLRLIPRLITARLTGHQITYLTEDRDFVYAEDINALVMAIVRTNTSGTIDCKSNQIINTKDLRDTIVHLTPTAYGVLTATDAKNQKIPPQSALPAADKDLASIIGRPTPFAKGFAATLRCHKERCYHQMEDCRSINDFLKVGDKVVGDLQGSSAAYLRIIQGADTVKKVLKVATRDGVEGNGIAKVANEINYYKHINRYQPRLAALYPRLLEQQKADTFSSLTIEYLDGPNYYEALQANRLPFADYRVALQSLIDTLGGIVLPASVPAKDPEHNLDTYYLERSLYRLKPVSTLMEVQDTVRVNGESLLAPHIILTKLLRDQRLRKFIKPQLECFCFHGDLTLLNTVYLEKAGKIRLIDPRGYKGIWDPLYDFAKMKFTLSGFGEFVLGSKEIVTQSKDGFHINLRRIPSSARRLNGAFFEMLEASLPFREHVIALEPYWKQRLTLAEATHYLADIPFRLYTDVTSASAMASYVMGTYYLNQAYRMLEYAND